MTNSTIKKDTLSSFEKFLDLPAPKVSFEFFPPKTTEHEQSLWETIQKLEPFDPEFVSVTYGAGGSTREHTHHLLKNISQKTDLPAAAHLTCIGSSKDEIKEIAESYLDIGVNHILALRGDAPQDQPNFVAHPNGYNHASDLVKGLKDVGDFEISVAAFPEVHPDAESKEKDLFFLKEKMDAGADRAITQFFFNPDIFLKFRDETQNIGITKPIIPGIILISNFKQIVRFSKMCGTEVPKWLYKLLDGLDEYPNRRQIISAMIAAEQCRILREEGVEQFHFYTLNRPELACSICHILGKEYKVDPEPKNQ